MKGNRLASGIALALVMTACSSTPISAIAAKKDSSVVNEEGLAGSLSSYPDSKGYIAAIKQGNISLVEGYVSRGAPINFIDDQSVHLAIHAVQSNNPQIVEYLASHGMDLNGYGRVSYTPIMLAARKQPDMLAVFIRHGADLDLISEFSSTHTSALSWSIQKRASGNAIALINAGANVSSLDSQGIPSIVYAFNQRDISVIKTILKHGGNPNYIDGNGENLVMASVKAGSIDILKILVEAGADLTARDTKGNTALSLAITGGNSQIVEYLTRQLEIT